METNKGILVKEAIKTKFDGNYSVESEYLGSRWGFNILYTDHVPTEQEEEQIKQTVLEIAPDAICYILPLSGGY